MTPTQNPNLAEMTKEELLDYITKQQASSGPRDLRVGYVDTAVTAFYVILPPTLDINSVNAILRVVTVTDESFSNLVIKLDRTNRFNVLLVSTFEDKKKIFQDRLDELVSGVQTVQKANAISTPITETPR